MKIAWQAYDKKDYTAGPIVNAVRVLPELVKREHQVYALIGYHGDEHPNADILAANGVEVVSYRIPYDSETHVELLLDEISSIRPDVFVSNVSVQAGFAGRWVRSWGIPVVHTIRSEDALNIGMSRFFFGEANPWNLDGLVSVNEHLLGLIEAESRYSFASEVIPSGVPIPALAVEDFCRPLSVVYAGRLTERQKRISKVLEHFIFSGKRDDRFRFSIIGSGEDAVKLDLQQKIDDLGLSERIVIHERKTGDRYQTFLRDHDVVVLMSDYEGIPGSLMDGMACGLIPLSTPVNGIEELIQDETNGFLFETNEAFLEVLRRIASDPDKRKELSRNARSTIEESFSLEVAVAKWERFLSELPKLKCKGVRMPRKIKLPPQHPLLLEHRSRPRKSALSRLNVRIRHKLRIS